VSEIKLIKADGSKDTRMYTSTERKIPNCNANIYFNKICLERNFTPKFASVEVKAANTSAAAKRTERQAQKLRIQNVI
jgi:hypothetical protein